jgi:hypothetical protein
MIQTVYYTNKNFPIPSNLIMEKVLALGESLDGQSIKIRSIFNPKDEDPSMVIFYSDAEGIYRFKDFSSGLYGDAIDIIVAQYNLSDRQLAYRKVLELFKDNADVPNKIATFQKEIKEILSYQTRPWLNADAEFWKQFGISGSFLKKYNIKPIKSYTIGVTKGDTKEKLQFQTTMCYGYFNNAGDLYKLYQPTRKSAKFLKIKEYTQGEEQITYDKQCLIIASSLKDIGAFLSLKLANIDLVAPDSENVTITPQQIDKYRQHYKYVFTMFDNDVAGMKAMQKYKEQFGIPYIYFNMEKDMAECVKQHGSENTRLHFIPIFKNALREHNKSKNNTTS